jgi:acyl-CoA synthetase (AMP-forming)/AMP-acid ligase II
LASPPTPVDEVTVAVLPLFHIYAIEMYLTHALTAGFKLVTMPRFDRDEFLAIVNRYKVPVATFLALIFHRITMPIQVPVFILQRCEADINKIWRYIVDSSSPLH